MLLFQKLYWIPIFNQYLLNKNDDTCPLLDTNIPAWIELTLTVKNMLWTLDGKIRIHAQLSNTSYMRLHSWTSVSLRRLYIGHFLSLHFKDRDEDFPSKGLKDILHDNKIFSCTMELPNESASLVVIFVLLYFVFIWDESVTSCFHQKNQKSFYSHDKNKLFSYDIIRGIQQATSISFFFFFFGNQRGNQKKTHFALFGSRSEHRFSCSLASLITMFQ